LLEGIDTKSLIREKLRRRLFESIDTRSLIRERLRRRLLEGRYGDVKSLIRERLGRRLLESKVSARERLRKLLEGRYSGIRSMIDREGLRRRLFEHRITGTRSMLREKLRGSLSEDRYGGIRSLIRERLRRRLLEGRYERVVGLVGARRLRDLGERRVMMLERELRRKRRLLKEAYKVVKRVNEMGGIHKIERALNLAHDTIVKAGAKLFKEAVDMISAETGVDKKRVAQLVKKVGLKEAREILRKKGSRVGNVPRTIIVEGIDSRKEQLPVLATRIAERLSKPVEAGNPGDLKQLGEAVFKKVGE